MVPSYGPFPSVKGSEVRFLGYYIVCKGIEEVPKGRAHIKGPCSYPKKASCFRLYC